MPAGYPLMPLTIRVRTGLSYIPADALVSIQQSQLFYQRAGIQLLLYNNKIERDQRLPSSANENSGIDDIVTKTWTPGQYWVDVIYFNNIHDASSDNYHHKGYTSTPGSQTQNIGILVAIETHARWSTLAHELGHALGLPHVFNEGENATLLPNGQRYIDAAMAPFLDETEALSEKAKLNNIMYFSAPDNTPSNIGITYTQIERMRLTLASQKDNLSQIKDILDSNSLGVTPLSFWPRPNTPSQILRSCFG